MSRRNRSYLWLSRHPVGRTVLHLLALRASRDRRAHVRGIWRELRHWRRRSG
jgi:hypothetical protein